MIADLEPYPTMKDSGVEWLGEVPVHWEIVPLGRLMVQRKEKNDPIKTKDILSLSLRTGVIPYAEKPAGGNKAKEDLSSYMLAYPGDIVVNSMNVVVGSVGLSKYFGAVSPVYYMLRPRQTCDTVEFFDQVFQARVFQKSLWGLGNGIMYVESKSGKLNTIRLRIPMTRLKKVFLPHPPQSEQAAIVRYLDHVDRRVRRLVGAKRKLIALLTEQRQAIIHRAVTRGLDPDVSLKDSGVEWLGQVPEHWEVRRIRNVANMRVSNVDKHIKAGEAPVRLCNYVDVYKHDRIDQKINFMRATATSDEIERFRLVAGDVLITKDSEAWDDIGIPALVTEPANDLISGYHLALLRPFPGQLAGGYLLHALQSKGLAYQFHVEAKGVTRYGLSHAGIKSVCLPLPPLSEQFSIVDYLNTATANIDTAIARANHKIELLNEYRTRLFADVVTGKLDVREAVAALPDVDPLSDDEPVDVLDLDTGADRDELEAIPEEAEA